MAEAVNEKDSLPFMHAIGVSTLISDSGVIRYHLVAEEWDIFNHPERPSSWRFCKGMLMERFDTAFHIDMYVQADTAYLHNQRLWELRGRVFIKNTKGETFKTSLLYWDQNIHEFYSPAYMEIQGETQSLKGVNFRSNEQMTQYRIHQSSGAFPFEEEETGPPVPEEPADEDIE